MKIILSGDAAVVKKRLAKGLRGCKSAPMRVRYLIVINLLDNRSAYEVAEILGVHNTTVYRVAKRFQEKGEAALFDRREDNGEEKLTEGFLGTLDKVVRSEPPSYGWTRPTWTREMLVKTLADLTGVHVHVTTMSRALRMIKARRGRPRPVVRCPWAEKARENRLKTIRRFLRGLPAGHMAFYEDEVDIHLNPKVGLDWMGYGQQKELVTPGQNQKRYLAGALDIETGMISWVEGERKNSDLFIALLHHLLQANPNAEVIHLVLDNCRIHHSEITQAVVQYLGGRVKLHFLPPYCPNHNKIERSWQDLHANVTRNHMCPDMPALMDNVRQHLQKHNREKLNDYMHLAA
jgi:transposase